jgi:hypothetical protein
MVAASFSANISGTPLFGTNYVVTPNTRKMIVNNTDAFLRAFFTPALQAAAPQLRTASAPFSCTVDVDKSALDAIALSISFAGTAFSLLGVTLRAFVTRSASKIDATISP